MENLLKFPCGKVVVVPIEVKPGKNYYRHNALDNVLESAEFKIPEGIVLSGDNVERKGLVTYLPIYMTMFLQGTKPAFDLIFEPDLSGVK